MLACAATAQAQSLETATQGGDATHRNAWAGTGLRPPLERAWAVPADPTVAPLVVGGRVVVATTTAIAALDAATGALAWSAPVTGELAADAGRVFVASPAGVSAVDFATGRILWSVTSAASGPVAADGRVFLGTSSGEVVARDAASGAVLWTTDTRIAGAHPAVSGGRVFAVGGCRAVALAADSGAPVWSKGDCGYDAGVRTVVAGAFVWGEDAPLHLASDGTRVSLGPSPGTAGAGLVLASPLAAPPSALIAADAGTFTRRWTHTPSLPGVVTLRPAAVDGAVFAVIDTRGADGAYLAALDPGTGREVWSGSSSGLLAPTSSTAIAAGPGVLVVPVAGGLVGLRNAPSGPLGVAATLPRNVVLAGTETVVTGTLASAGHGLVGPRAVSLQADPFPFDDAYVPVGFAVAGRAGFSFTAGVARNTRYRLAADGVVYAPTPVYAQPSLTVAYARTASKRLVRATLRVAAADGLRRAGGRVAVYRLKRRGSVAQRLGAGRSASSGVARFTVHIPGTLKRTDRVFTCLRGASRQGFGVANVIDRRCGDPRIPLPTATTSTNVSPKGRYMALYATQLP